MGFSKLQFAPYPRNELRQHIDRIRVSSNSPMPAAAVDEVADLACHAAQTARDALMRVLDSASHPAIANTAIGIAASLLRSDMDRIEAGLREFSENTGAPFFCGTITVGGQAHG